MEKYSTFISLQRNKNETTVRYYSIFTRMTKVCWLRCVVIQLSYFNGDNVKWYKHIQIYLVVSPKVKHTLRNPRENFPR